MFQEGFELSRFCNALRLFGLVKPPLKLLSLQLQNRYQSSKGNCYPLKTLSAINLLPNKNLIKIVTYWFTDREILLGHLNYASIFQNDMRHYLPKPNSIPVFLLKLLFLQTNSMFTNSKTFLLNISCLHCLNGPDTHVINLKMRIVSICVPCWQPVVTSSPEVSGSTWRRVMPWLGVRVGYAIGEVSVSAASSEVHDEEELLIEWSHW